MPSIYDLKPAFQHLLRPLARKMAQSGISANVVTLASCALSIVWGLGIALSGAGGFFLIGTPIILFIRMALNAIDGMLAREFGYKSDYGFYLNELTDIISDIALYCSLVAFTGVNSALAISFVFIAVLTEVAGILALGLGKSRRYDGPFGKSDRALAFGSLCLIHGLWPLPGAALNIILLLFISAGAYTISKRIQKGLAHE